MLRTIVLLFGLFLLPVSSFAADGSSGCGPAWYIFKENTLVSSALRLTTNAALFPLVTLGMTFGTSNCAQHKIVDANKRSEHLATVGYERLRQDVAMGSGEFLDAYAATFQCSDQALPAFRSTLQANFQRIFQGEAAPVDVVKTTREIVKGDANLSTGCGAV